jgi:hypothetical protein
MPENAPSNNGMHPTGNSVNVIRQLGCFFQCFPAGDAGRYASSLMSAEQENTSRSERINLLATQNRRRRERSLLSAEVSRITGQPIAEDELQVAVSLGDIDYSFANVGDGAKFERSLPEDYPERNQQLLAEFGRVIQEQNILLYIRLYDVWYLSLSSEVAFSHMLAFASLESTHNPILGGSFRVTSSDSECGFDLSLHRYFRSINNHWECYRKTWELSVLGRRWCEIAKQMFVPESEA